jgi:hypothetical protein
VSLHDGVLERRELLKGFKEKNDNDFKGDALIFILKFNFDFP